MVKNLSWKNKQTNLREIDGFEQKVAQNCRIGVSDHKQIEKRTSRLETVDAHAAGHARTNVRFTHVQT